MKNVKKVTLLLLGIAIAAYITVYAAGEILLSDTEGVNIKSSSIEDSTLIIGNHLIHITQLNDKIYELAIQSQLDSGQQSIYYKSELASGDWFDLGNALSLEDITPRGNRVEESVIESLLLRYHTKSDGKTYDLKTGRVVNIYNLPDPYNIKDNPATKSLSIQKQLIDESRPDSEEAKDNKDMVTKQVDKLFAMSLSNPLTKKCDEDIRVLGGLVIENPEEKESLNAAMSKVDALRRKEADSLLLEGLENLLNNVQGKGFPELESAIAEGIAVSSQRVDEFRLRSIDKSSAEGRAMSEAIEALIENPDSAENLARLSSLVKMEKGLMLSASARLKVLEENLLPASRNTLENLFARGESEEYQRIRRLGEPEALLDSCREKDMSEVNNAFDEYIGYATEYLKLQDDEEALLSELNFISTVIAKVPRDDYRGELIDKGEKIKRALLSSSSNVASGEESINRVREEIDKLKLEHLKALDKQDNVRANEIEDSLQILQARLAGMQSNLSDDMKKAISDRDALIKALEKNPNDYQLASQIAKLDAQIEAFRTAVSKDGEIVEELKLSALEKVGKGVSAKDEISGLAVLMEAMPKEVLASLKEIYARLSELLYIKDKPALHEDLEMVHEIVVGNAGLLAKSFDESALDRLLSLSGENEEDILTAKTVAYDIVLQQLDNKQIQTSFRRDMDELQKKQAALMFPAVDFSDHDMIPLTVVAERSGGRYVWNAMHKIAVITNSNGLYSWKAYSAEVVREDDHIDVMDSAAAFQNQIYIPKSYAQKEFGVDFHIFKEHGYGIVLSSQQRNLIEEYVSEINKILDADGMSEIYGIESPEDSLYGKIK